MEQDGEQAEGLQSKVTGRQGSIQDIRQKMESSNARMYKKLNELVKRYNVKQKTVTQDNIEMTVEVRLRGNEPGFVNQLTALGGVKNAVLISYSGDYVS